MNHSVQLKHYWPIDYLNNKGSWLVKDVWSWHVSQNGILHIQFDNEEDKCVFILKYGEYIA